MRFLVSSKNVLYMAADLWLDGVLHFKSRQCLECYSSRIRTLYYLDYHYIYIYIYSLMIIINLHPKIEDANRLKRIR